MGTIKYNIKNLNSNILILLYKSLVRPHLDYCAQVYSPYLKKDIKKLEDVQRRATKLIPEYKNLNYETRLKKLGLTSLEKRRQRGDLIQTYKIVKKLENVKLVNSENWLSSRTLEEGGRNHQYRIRREIVKNCPARFNFLYNRVSNSWNSLKPFIVNSKNTNCFKNNIDKYLM